MKKEFLYPLTGAVLVASTLFTATPAFAAGETPGTGGTETGGAGSGKSATSKATVKFEAGSDATDPLDPNNPDSSKPDNNDPEDQGNTGTGNAGPLSLDYVSNFSFGTQKVSGKTVTYNSKNTKPYVQVTDTRGTSAGWSVTVSATVFKAQKDTSTVELKGAELSLKNFVAKKPSANTASAPTPSDVTFNNQDAKLFANAASDTGEGTWLFVAENPADVQLKVIGGTAKTGLNYQADLTWTATDGPQAPPSPSTR